ncbi:hypothetical protein ABNM12_02450 [Pseudomonas syringae]|uniref:hypothetical protein n=1 Tax=Pseudomonas TaxID=286 RepID=UPI000464483E|nr:MULTISPECIES: hypothetical protein [Pseudomonas]KTB78133.1 hypothetical protein AO069_00565 [Pseudomonas syringae pv. syringae PD2774]KWS18226.1 hypothetical protein AL064_24610 [Pseudomonas syringae pv. syringae]KWS20775.1 hypothetical protein AL062_02345 [Pseudomonas syringae pv. syringae]KWS27960.1 hypothetical protein AL061_10435 [Pseudomonas syringae pv. syringae]MCH5513141.1 hypothetical protein [Pseudomonas syringae pv. syringae]
MFDVLIEAIFRAICFPVGWPIVKLLTRGKYPSKGSWFAYTPESEWTSAVGFTVLMIATMAAMKQFIFP